MIVMKKIEDYNDVLSVADVQKILGVGRTKAYALLSANDIEWFCVGRSKRILKSNLLRYIQKQTQQRGE